MRQFVKWSTAIIVVLVAALVFKWFPHSSAPYDLPKSPIQAIRIAGSEVTASNDYGQPGTIEGWKILQVEDVESIELKRDLRDIFTDPSTYYTGPTPACFEPGIAIRLGGGGEQVVALICLSCQKVYFIGGSKSDYRQLSTNGVERFVSLYSRLFPGRNIQADAIEVGKLSMQMQRDESERRHRLDSSATRSTPLETSPTTQPQAIQ